MQPSCDTPVYSKQQGFNLLELLVVLGLMAITLGVLVPSGQELVEKSRLISATNTTYTALLYTRNEATRLKNTTLFCFINSPADSECSDTFSGLLGTLSKKEGDELKLKLSHEITSQVNLTFKGVEAKKIEFESRGNRKNSDKAVYLEVSTEKHKRQIEVCFNGRVLIRETLNKSECK